MQIRIPCDHIKTYIGNVSTASLKILRLWHFKWFFHAMQWPWSFWNDGKDGPVQYCMAYIRPSTTIVNIIASLYFISYIRFTAVKATQVAHKKRSGVLHKLVFTQAETSLASKVTEWSQCFLEIQTLAPCNTAAFESSQEEVFFISALRSEVCSRGQTLNSLKNVYSRQQFAYENSVEVTTQQFCN